MIIKELELKGYRRLLLSGHAHIVLTLESLYQIILGTNGCGKSSLLDEMFPLPANASDFDKGGLKRFVCEHAGHRYVLTSSFDGKATHSFLKDDVELNEGKTITVQRDLVQQEFGLTEELRDFMVGKLRLTEMTPAKRREFITAMSDNDMTYAMSTYKRIATIVRDNQGTIKHLRGRITKEADALKAIATEDEIEDTVATLQEELTLLMENRHPNLPDSEDVKHRLHQALGEADEVAYRVLSQPFYQAEEYQFTSADELLAETTSLQATIKARQEMLDRYVEDHGRMADLVGSLESTGVKNLDELQTKAEELSKQIGTAEAKLSMFRFDGDVKDLEADAQTIKSQLAEILSLLPDNSDAHYSKAKLKEIEDRITSLRSQRDSADSKRRRAEQDIDHLLEAKDTKCPKCGYVWKDGVSEHDLERRKRLSVEFMNVSEKASKELEEVLESREKILEYSSQYNRFRTLAHSYPKASNLFNWLMEEKRIMYQPSQYIPVVDKWLHDLHISAEIWTLKCELDIVRNAIDNATALSDTNGGQLQTNVQDIEKHIDTLTVDIQAAKRELTKLSDMLRRAKQMEQDGERINRLMNTIVEDQKLLYECLRSEKLSELIRNHQSQLAVKTHQLNEKKALENIIRDLNASLTEVEESHDVYKLLMRALSPTEGEIARQLTAFITCVTEQMNDVIAQIYTYPLHILPCAVESGVGELDYKFPLLAGEDKVPVVDVSKGSKGQKEIIDFAFRLVALLYFGFSDFPLYVDELGSSQDEQHHTNVMNYIKLLIESHHYTQLFMISHLAVGHGAFTQADVCVLSETNITVPGEYNQHVVLQ